MEQTTLRVATADQWDTPASALNAYGIRHLAPRVRARNLPLRDEDLFRTLATSRSVRLQDDLGPRRLITPAYLDELDLPSLEIDWGRATLVTLSNREEVEFGYDAWAGYSSLMDRFLSELINPGWGRCDARVRRARQD